MTTLSDNRSRRIEAIDLFVDLRGNHHAVFEDKSEHKIIVDRTYQRPLDQRKVESIRANWDSIAADPITLSLRRNGDAAIVNGQHEMQAALLEGETCLLAEIFEGLSVDREAEMRLIKNNQRPDTALEKFHARLASEKKRPGVATAIVALLAEFDTYVNQSPSQYAGINCVGTVERLYSRDGGIVLRRALRTLVAAYGEIKGDVATAPMIEGTAWFLHAHYGEYSERKVIGQLQKFGPADLNDMARGFKRAMGGADWLNHYRALVEAYNKVIRKVENKLELKTARWSAEHGGSYASRKVAEAQRAA